MEWTWDNRKAASNLAKHGVPFEVARDALDDQFALPLEDDHPDGIVGERLAWQAESCYSLFTHLQMTGAADASSAHAVPRPPSEGHMSEDRYSPKVEASLRELRAKGDADIDLSDMPEVTDWSKAKRGLWHRIKRDDLVVMLEPKVMAWFRDQGNEGEDVDEMVNRVMRERVIGVDKRAA